MDENTRDLFRKIGQDRTGVIGVKKREDRTGVIGAKKREGVGRASRFVSLHG